MKIRRKRARKDRVVDSLYTLPKLIMESEATDPLGSYTGTPADGGTPVQDADDL